MKKISIIVSMITLFVGFSSTVSAQVSATAISDATIVTPIAISKATDMHFGNLAVNSTGGTVIMPAAAAAALDVNTGGVTLPNNAGTVSAASFDVTGQSGYTYDLTIPTAPINLTHTDGTTTMSLGTFTSSPTVAAGGVLTGGAETVYVGATLTVAGAQLAGTYTTATPFSVEVNYN